MRTFNRQEVLEVTEYHKIPAEYQEEFVALFTGSSGSFNWDRKKKGYSNRLYKKLAIDFILVNNAIADLRGMRPRKGRSITKELEKIDAEAIRQLG